MDTVTSAQVINKDALLRHWLGHRNLTRRVIEAFPEKELFGFSIGGMRPFSQLAIELLSIGGPAMESIVKGEPLPYNEEALRLITKEQILAKWDEQTDVITRYFNQLPLERFSETFNLFGQYEFPIIDNIFYFIDNEIHHRGQGYVYLRALDIEPPMFWERD
ncbi:damage-inducible protein DinB [Olivibacter sp. SA151]|uniref:DinB family protein n=1 Tax=Olivibacter jilunii TaxID=985016 RepID=UPI003F152195